MHPTGSTRTFTAEDTGDNTAGGCVMDVQYPDRPDTADRTVRASALNGPVTVIAKHDTYIDAYRVRNASGAEFTAWDDELEN